MWMEPSKQSQCIFEFHRLYTNLGTEKCKMNLIIFVSVIGLSSAGLLPSRNYIPQSQGSQVQQQGSYTQTASFHNSQSSLGGGGFGDDINRRPQQETEKNAAILKQDQDMSEVGGYHFGFETSNGIRAEEAGNPVEAQGGFFYKGDDGHTYTVIYTSGVGGFRAQGDHLPVAPPTPQVILEALEKNARDEAAGIFDDGQYHPDVHGGGQHKAGFKSGSGNTY